MPRNAIRDAREEQRRRMQLQEVGFSLFSQFGIDNVSMNMVAEAALVGPTTLFKYYKTKEQLVIAISGMVWSHVWQSAAKRLGEQGLDSLNAWQRIWFFTEVILAVYRDQPDILRFSSDYKTFVRRSHVSNEQLHEHLDPLAPIGSHFHEAFVKAGEDGSIRPDIPEDTLFTATTITMLAVAERYAQGIVWGERGGSDHMAEMRATQ